MHQKHIEEAGSGIVCDNPKCDYEDMTVSHKDLDQWLNKPCPKCGENLLTEEDFKDHAKLMATVNLLNSMSEEQLEEFGKLLDIDMKIDENASSEKRKTVQFHVHNGINVKVIE
jgi:uncharacterized paraquat-inducible protein A